MPHDRFFTNEALIEGSSISLDESESRHARSVMRKREGDRLELVNGRGELAKATLLSTTSPCVVKITSVEREEEPLECFHLVVMGLRLSLLEWLVEKGTELGITMFSFLAETKKPTKHQLERLERLCQAALKQSGRRFLPTLSFLEKLEEVQSDGALFYGSLQPDLPTFSSCLPQSNVTFFVGPPSGWTSYEERVLEKLGAKPVRLSKTTLRSETAALAGCVWMTGSGLS